MSEYLTDCVWDNPRHAIQNLVTLGYTPEDARDIIREHLPEMRFSYSDEMPE